MIAKVIYCCQVCGNSSHRWTGRCTACGAWDSILEEVPPHKRPITNLQSCPPPSVVHMCSEEAEEVLRFSTESDELDRVFGGGIVAGSSTLIGGEPGISKSALMLQLSASLAQKYRDCLYVSGEESVNQIRARAQRIKMQVPNVKLVATASLNDIMNMVPKSSVQLLVIDSIQIQTLYDEQVSSSPGTVTQVRMCAHKLIVFARQKNIVLFILGQVTKEGVIAGPQTLEHMVDTVLYFKGSNGTQLRILRTVKNRFGPINKIGVFEMSEFGLAPVLDPSLLFLGQSHKRSMPGNVVFAGIEGSRPLLVEVQSLISSTYMASPRRAVVGWDINRLAMIIAVLHTRCDMFLANKGVYLNIAGGLRISEPASDLAIAASLISSATKTSAPTATVIFEEVALSGEVRKVSNADARLRKACKLGFKRAVVPNGNVDFANLPVSVSEITHIKELQRFFT